ncbi:MAG: hypothetical protein LBG60_09625 [Bifidobacteriaceae bacterium]|nr:hypothetical protein [Bifidobacteriaceae bacterium]
MQKRSVTILGATGSIGRQAAEVIERRPDRFRVEALAAAGSRPAELVSQIARLRPAVVALPNDDAAAAVRQAAAAAGVAWPGGLKTVVGPSAAAQAAAIGSDVVLNGITGAAGLAPTLAALAAGSTLALANKESLVIGGALVTGAVRREDQLVPVDSDIRPSPNACGPGGRARSTA